MSGHYQLCTDVPCENCKASGCRTIAPDTSRLHFRQTTLPKMERGSPSAYADQANGRGFYLSSVQSRPDTTIYCPFCPSLLAKQAELPLCPSCTTCSSCTFDSLAPPQLISIYHDQILFSAAAFPESEPSSTKKKERP